MSENKVEIQKQISKNALEMANQFQEFERANETLNKKFDSLEQDKVKKLSDSMGALQQENNDLKTKLKTLDSKLEIYQKAEEEQGENPITSYRQKFRDFVYGGSEGRIDSELAQKAVAEYVNKYSPSNFSKSQKEKVTKSLFSTDIGPNGGYLIMPEVDSQIREGRALPVSPMRKLARVQPVSIGSMKFPYDDEQFTIYEREERQSQSSLSSIDLAEVQIDVRTLTTKVKITNDMLEDSSQDIESWVLRKVERDLVKKEGALFQKGTSANGIRGFNSYELSDTYARNKIQKVSAKTANIIEYDDLIKLTQQSGLEEIYQANATMLLNRAIFGEVLKIVDNDNRPIFNPQFIVMQESFNWMGANIEFDGYMTSTITDNNSRAIYYGDVAEAYVILDRRGMSVIRDIYKGSADGSVELTISKRVGGGLINFDSLRCLNVNNT